MISENEITRRKKNNCYVSTLKTALCSGKCISTNRKVLKEILQFIFRITTRHDH